MEDRCTLWDTKPVGKPRSPSAVPLNPNSRRGRLRKQSPLRQGWDEMEMNESVVSIRRRCAPLPTRSAAGRILVANRANMACACCAGCRSWGKPEHDGRVGELIRRRSGFRTKLLKKMARELVISRTSFFVVYRVRQKLKHVEILCRGPRHAKMATEILICNLIAPFAAASQPGPPSVPRWCGSGGRRARA